jgi:hypothetical protein
MVIDVQRLAPRFPTIGRHVHTAIGARRIQLASDGQPNDVRIGRMHDNATEGLHSLKADARERLAGIGALVQSVTVGRRLTIVRLAGRDVQDVRIAGRQR